MKIKIIVLLSLLFIVINTTIFYMTKINKNQKVDIVLQDNLKTLQTHYKILLETQKSTAQAIYQSTLRIPGFTETLAEANHATKERKAELRAKLGKILAPMYARIKKRGVLQYHFLLPSNESFYRAHKPNKFGDNLTDIRADFKYTNETQKPIRGFTQGRTAHGFRNTFPLFDKQGTHIGAMEISFSSDSLQWYLNNVSGIHTHFLVKKDIFETNAWKRDDLILNYEESAEAPEYMITLNSIHTKEKCIDENIIKLQPIREEIELNMLKGEEFSSYVEHNKHIDVISFLPIKNLEKKTVAWIVSYEKSPIIEMALQNTLRIRISVLLLSILFIYFLLKQIRSKDEIQKQYKLLNYILNATDNVMFITDFKDINFSNNKFKDLLNVKHSEVFNSSSNHNMLQMFVPVDGYLHEGLLNANESFAELILKTAPADRIVSILDKNFEPAAFKISISKPGDDGEYLVTLSDITKIKERQVQTEKKAYLDALTKVYNRNKFDEVFAEELARVKRYNAPFTLALIDIDKFKDFNDTYGHLIGDEVLIKLAQTVNENLRDTDIFARWGGEEFVILFKNISIESARLVSQKLKDKIEENEHPIAGKITASFGLSEYVDGDTTESMFMRCDKALYKAKENGRNRVEVL